MEQEQKQKKTILIVEDEEPLRRMFADKMRFEGFKVLEAKDGEEGLTLAIKEHPDIISLDVVMPRMDGFSMLKKLRQDQWGKSVPVIIWSAYSDQEKKREAQDLCADDFLVKSAWSLKDVVRKVKERLGE